MSAIKLYPNFRAAFSVSGSPDIHGWEKWPTTYMYLSGFAISMTKPVSSLPTLITVNGLATDSTPYTDEYDWYVSQRTDNPANQYLDIQRSDVWPDTRSGTISLGLTALGTTYFGGLTIDELVGLFKHVYIYAQRRADRATAMLDVSKYLFSDTY